MKRLLFLALIAFSTVLNAQKNTILLQGSINYYNQKGEYSSDQSSNSIGFSPKIGYQFNSNWTLGVESSFSNYKYSSTNSEFTNKQFTAGVFVRYAKPLNDLFTFYSDLGIGYQDYYRTQNDSNNLLLHFNSKGYYTSFTPAVLMNIGKGFGLNFNIGGMRYSQNNNALSPYGKSNFYFTFGNYYAIGISKNFK